MRDRAILTVQRLLDAQGSVFQESGYNKRKVANSVLTKRLRLDVASPSQPVQQCKKYTMFLL